MQVPQVGFGQSGEKAQQAFWCEAIDGVNNQGANSTPAATREVKSKRVTESYLTHKVFVKASKRSVEGMVSKLTSKVAAPWRTSWSPPKDKDPMVSQSDAIYWYQCGDLTCDDEYIGETSRTFGERYKEDLKDPSPIHHHNNQNQPPH